MHDGIYPVHFVHDAIPDTYQGLLGDLLMGATKRLLADDPGRYPNVDSVGVWADGPDEDLIVLTMFCDGRVEGLLQARHLQKRAITSIVGEDELCRTIGATPDELRGYLHAANIFVRAEDTHVDEAHYARDCPDPAVCVLHIPYP